MSEESAIQLVESNDLTLSRAPELTLDDAEKSASALANRLFTKLAPPVINGKKYPTVEHWQTVASFYGVTARILSCVYVEYGEAKGFEASAEAITTHGVAISRAEALCLSDEPRWAGRPLHQVKAMAQTRAVSRCLRNVFSRIMVLAGCEATPAEDADGTWDAGRGGGGHNGSAPVQQPKAKPQAHGKRISEPRAGRIWALAREAYPDDSKAKENKVKAVCAAYGFVEPQGEKVKYGCAAMVTEDVYEQVCKDIQNLNWAAPVSAATQAVDAIESLVVKGEVKQKVVATDPDRVVFTVDGIECYAVDDQAWTRLKDCEQGTKVEFKCARKKGTPNPNKVKIMVVLRVGDVGWDESGNSVIYRDPPAASPSKEDMDF